MVVGYPLELFVVSGALFGVSIAALSDALNFNLQSPVHEGTDVETITVITILLWPVKVRTVDPVAGVEIRSALLT